MRIITIGTSEFAKGRRIIAQVTPVSGGYAVGEFIAEGQKESDGGWRLMPKRIYKTKKTVTRSAIQRGYSVID